MTILQVIKSVDNLIPNNIDTSQKVFWLSELDGREADSTIKYDIDTPTDTELAIPHPYDGIYIDYLGSKIALMLDDTARYNTFVMLYQDDLEAYKRHKASTTTTDIQIRYGV